MKTVYVGLSGGVDSSVTAALLQQEGYRVVGVYMQNWTESVGGVECPWRQDLTDAQAVAAQLDIPFKVFDFQREYKQKVVDVMVAEYAAGRTPNPDVLCNQEIKFKLFLDAALADGADLIATGHYARVADGKLLAGLDPNKDQSYFLCRVSKEALAQTLMPIGEYHKPEVRALAQKLSLSTASKPDSQGICFIGEVSIKDFLQQYIPAKSGSIILQRTGEQIGQHDGAAYYTTGQRHGLGIGGGKPYYITIKDMKQNILYVTDDPQDLVLAAGDFSITDIHWIAGEPDLSQSYQVRNRYRGALVESRLEKGEDGYIVHMEHPERAVTSGQTAVVYDGDEVLGGGIIQAASLPLPAIKR
jgi:tRNA-specific 2-thiouridylase